MTAVRVSTDERDWLYTADDLPALPTRWWAMLSARLVDETTGRPPRAAVRLAVEPDVLSPRVGADGLIGAVGQPWRYYSPLLQASFPLSLAVSADGFLPLSLATAVPVDRRQVFAAAASGDTVITLDNAAGITAGDRVLLGPVARAELVSVASPGPGGDQLTLRGPLARDHAAGSVAVPERFAPLAVGDLALHRLPIVLYGRTLRRTATGLVVVPGAQVRIIETWRRPPPATGGVAPDPWVPAAVQPPLVGDWPAGTGRATVRALPRDAAVALKRLGSEAQAGDRRLLLSDRVGLGVGDILIVDAGVPDRVEFVAIQALTGGLTATEPAIAALDQPLAFAHARETRVARADPQPPGAVKAISQAARTGDPCVLLADLAGIAAATEIELSVSGVAPPPFAHHRITPYVVQSGAMGDYRLPPLSRVGQLTLRASATGLTDVDVRVVPDYPSGAARVDLIFN